MHAMQTRPITVDVPVEVLLSTHLNAEQFARELRETLAFELFAEGRLSGGKAAQLAGLSRVVFLIKAGERGIDWLAYGQDELRRELTDHASHL